MADTTANGSSGAGENGAPKAKKQILLNAFDMSTVGHLSPGQWKVRPSLALDSRITVWQLTDDLVFVTAY